MNNNNRTLHLRHWLTLLMLWAVTSPVCGADTSAVAEDTLLSDARNGSRAQAQLQQRFIRDFSEFAGSAENAQSLYGGLRTGSRITLSAHATSSDRDAGIPVLQFNAEARAMGHGSAFISMALAKQQLVNYGIGRPTPWQIQAALNGGAIIPGNGGSQPVALKGVLAQREAGLGWTVIAKASGISLGRVLDGLRNPPTDAVALARSNTNPNVPAVKRGSRYAAANGAPGPIRTSISSPAQGTGFIAQ
jgi:hypothetical protein